MNLLNQYTTYLTERGKSYNTISSYTNDIKLFFKFYNTSLILTITRDQVLSYKNYLKNEKNYDASTVNRALSSLKSYNEFLIINNHQDSMVILSADYIKIQKSFSSPNKITEKELVKFLDKVKTNECIRNYAIIVTIVNTGLRISEVLDMKLSDYKKETSIIGKGNKKRNLYLNPKVIKFIDEYLEVRDKYKYASISPYLFVSERNKKLSECTIERIFNKYSNKITPHALRHYFADEFLRRNPGETRQLQELLGHSSLETTQIYTHPSKLDMKRNVDKVSIG